MTTPDSANPLWPRLRLVLIGLLLLLAAAYLGKGFYVLTCGRGGTAPDLQSRHNELRYVLQHQNPYDISALAVREEGLPARLLAATPPTIDPVIGPLSHGSGYPPWAFLWNFLFVWPVPLHVLRVTFALLNLAALAALTVWLRQLSLPLGRPTANLATAAFLALSAHCSTLINGQFTLLLLALMAATVWLAHRRHEWSAGVCFALTLMKPTMVAPLAMALLLQRKWITLAVAAGLTALATAFISGWVDANPLAMAAQMMEQTSRVTETSYSLFEVLLRLGLPPQPTLLLCGLGGIALTVWLLRRPAPTPLPPELYILAVTGTIARLHIYHRTYDNSLVGFLLIALLLQAVHRPSLNRWALALAVGISLWLPGSLCALMAVRVAQLTLWTFGLWVLTRPPELTLASRPVAG